MATVIAQYQANRNGSRSAPSSVSIRGSRGSGSHRQLPGTRIAGAASITRDVPVLNWLDWQLLDTCRRDFPVCEKPFEEIARRVNSRTDEVLRRFEGLERCGVVDWIGPMPTPETVGTSTLVAMAAPKARLRSIREAVTRYRGVGHICERDHEFNLWFALAAPNAGDLYDAVADIRRRTGVEVLDLRLERDYCGDVEFRSPRQTSPGLCRAATETSLERYPPLGASDSRLLAAIQEGLPLMERPYAAVAKQVGISEARVIERLTCLLDEGLIASMGVTVGHGSPGFGPDALVVFDVSRHAVDKVGERLAETPWVEQCHRCIPRAPIWPYNLYCTLHDRDLARLISWVDEEFPGTIRCPQRAVLPSRNRYSACEEH
ncbi:MAG: hypothetical protein OXI90_17595 [Gammaproteobacteria bacterium]|nr:hypothetical protein [Gammaproteobacteria bacterium]